MNGQVFFFQPVGNLLSTGGQMSKCDMTNDIACFLIFPLVAFQSRPCKVRFPQGRPRYFAVIFVRNLPIPKEHELFNRDSS